ncbi:MAG TPA: hypothetical protein VMC08_03605, partial [Bacteroidales bacterium]|nr:hypothetical protein [Bacteroidales bacterium]
MKKQIPGILVILFFTLHATGQQKPVTENGGYYPRTMRLYDSVQATRIPPLKILPGQLKSTLPPYVNNAENQYFPGIFDQHMFFTCQQYAGVSYPFAYEINRLRNAPGNTDGNRYPAHYTWTFMNDGDQYKGVSYFYSWEVIREQGIPDLADFGPDTMAGNTGWMTGYDKYYRGMHNRLRQVFSIPVNTEEGLLTLKNWLYDHLDGSPAGGVACYSASAGFTAQSMKIIPAGLPEEGKNLLIAFYPDATHGMTIVGYNDSVRYDLNGDGRFTNDLDINGDGIVDLKDHEIGAYLIANSYGSWWGDQGFFYAMYRALALDYDNGSGNWIPDYGVWNHCVYVLEPDSDYEPLLTAKVNLDYNYRDRIRIRAGISTDTAQQIPQHVGEFPVFAFQGGPYPMTGFDSSGSRLEFGLDLTPLLSYAEPGKLSRLFLTVEERDSDNSGHGTLNNLSFLDYSGATKEFVCPRTGIPVVNNGTTFASATGTVNFDKVQVQTASLPAFSPGQAYDFTLQASGGTPPYSWSLVTPVTKMQTDSAFPAGSGQVLHPFSLYIPYAKVALPFSFPFNGMKYDTLWVNAYGFISFDPQMLPYPYTTDEEGMIRSNKVISPAFNINFSVDPQATRIWAATSPSAVTIRWKLPLTGYENFSENNFALRLHPDGTFEFLYGPMTDEGFTCTAHSGFSAGDGSNWQTWTDWDLTELA